MKSCAAVLAVLFLSSWAQTTPQSEAQSATFPITRDHSRIVIDVSGSLPDGSTTRIRCWVDNGTSDLSISRRVATLLHVSVTCDDTSCSAPPPREIIIGE